MRYLDSYKQFEARTDEVPELNLKPGEAIIATENIDSKDIDFKKTAKTWWGKNVSSSDNLAKEKGLWFKKGQVMFIATEKYNDSKQVGYHGGVTREWHDGDDYHYAISAWPYESGDLREKFYEIAVHEGKAKIVNYNELPQRFKTYFETIVKLNEIGDAVRNKNKEVIYYPRYTGTNDDGVVVLELEYPREGKKKYYKVKGFDKDTKKKVDEYYIHFDNIMDAVFKINGEVFNKDEILFKDTKADEVIKNRFIGGADTGRIPDEEGGT